MEDEAAAGLDRAAVMNAAIGRLAGFDLELPQQAAEADPGALVADADADRAILVVDAHRDHRALEARIGHSRHRQQQLARQERRQFQHANDNGLASRGGQDLRRLVRRAYLPFHPNPKENPP